MNAQQSGLLTQNMTPEQARLLDQQLRQEQFQGKSYGGGALGNFLTSASGAIQGAAGAGQALAERFGAERQVGATEQAAVKRQGVIKEQQQEGTEAMAQAVTSSTASPEEKANLLRLFKAGQITSTQVLTQLKASKADSKVDYKTAIAEARQYGVSPATMINAMKTGDFSEVPAYTAGKQGELTNFYKDVLGFEANQINDVFGDKAGAVTGAILAGQVKNISVEGIQKNIITIVNSPSDKEKSEEKDKTVNSMVDALGIPANVLQGYSTKAITEAYQFYLRNPQLPQDKRAAQSLDKLVSSSSTGNTVSGIYKGANLQDVLGLGKESYNNLPTELIIKGTNLLHSPLKENESTESRMSSVRSFILEGKGASTPSFENLPEFTEIAGAKYSTVYSSASISKANNAYNKGRLEGESVKDFRVRISSTLKADISDSKQAIYDEYEATANGQEDLKRTAGKAYRAIDSAFTGFFAGAKTLAAKVIPTGGAFDSEIVATEYLDRIMSAITLNDASKLKGAMSDKDLKFLVNAVGNKDLNASSIKIALQELMIDRTEKTLVYNKMNELRTAGDIQAIENFNIGSYLNATISTKDGKKVTRSVAARRIAMGILGGNNE